MQCLLLILKVIHCICVAMNLARSRAVVVFLVIVIMSSSSSSAMVSSINEVLVLYPQERDALMQLRDIVNSSINLHANWTGPPCMKSNQSRWVGIVCSNWHIIHIVLEGIQLTGSLPLPPSPHADSFLQNITFLTRLSFRNNSIYSNLPNLTNLVHLRYISFSNNRFSGYIPPEYIGLPKLTTLELQQNSLSGPIPPFDQQTLKSFNVSDNDLEGPIPLTFLLQGFPKSSFDHNPYLCGRPLDKPCPVVPPPTSAPPPLNPPPQPPNHKKKKKKNLQVWSIALIAAAAALVPFVVMLVFLCYYKKMHGKEVTKGEPKAAAAGARRESWEDERKTGRSESAEDPERTVELEFFDKNIQNFDLDDLLRASAEVLGKGKLGTSYKAMLESGSVIAVKRLKEMNGLSKKEFIQQMQLLGKMRHQNLVQIISFYYSKEEKLVIYEFVPHGNLFELLHENRGVGRIPLSWTTRVSIIIDVAKGLNFLHQSLPSHKVPHANLNSSNILIIRSSSSTSSSYQYQSKLTDFGFLPLLPLRKSIQKLAVGRSPEFLQGKKLTHKADVYCFGIILLEIITGKMSPTAAVASDQEDLSDWVRTVVDNDWSSDTLDLEILAAKEGHDEMLKLTEIALECTDTAPEKRPKMSQVLRKIHDIFPEDQNTE